MHPNQPKPWRRTPLIESTNLSKAAGCRIFLKLENLQPSGSFKSRGVGNYILRALQSSTTTTSSPEHSRIPKEKNVHFFSSSGGNAGLACVHAANFFGCPATVVVPLSTKEMMVAKLRAAGAKEVRRFGATWREADAYLKEVVMKEVEGGKVRGVYVPPFDHEHVWEGNETVVKEVEEQMRELLGHEDAVPDVLVCSVGGGGLFNGIVQGVEARLPKWDKTTVLAVETQGAESLARSLEARELITLPGITSQATSLGATRVSERTFELARKHSKTGLVKSAVLTDAEAAMGCWRFADDERIVVELACGVNLALCYGRRLEKALGRPVRKEDKVVIVVCGGQNVTTAMVEGWRREFGDLDQGVQLTNGHKEEMVVPSAVTATNGV